MSPDTQSNTGLCSISGAKPSQTLNCGPTTLAAGTSFTVHITASTSASECSAYDNKASVTSTNDGGGFSDATITCNTQVSQITPTQTTCAQFAAGTAQTEGPITYSTKGTTISQTAPGVIFYWVKVTVSSAGSKTFTITQSTTYSPTTGSKLFTLANGSFAYNSNCSTLNTTIGGTDIGRTVTFTAPAAGTYFIGLKYTTSGVVGSSPSTTNYLYTFSSSGVNNSTSTVALNHK